LKHAYINHNPVPGFIVLEGNCWGCRSVKRQELILKYADSAAFKAFRLSYSNVNKPLPQPNVTR